MKALVNMDAVSERRGQVAEITEVKSGHGKRHAYYRLRFPDGDGGWFRDNEVALVAASASATGEGEA